MQDRLAVLLTAPPPHGLSTRSTASTRVSTTSTLFSDCSTSAASGSETPAHHDAWKEPRLGRSVSTAWNTAYPSFRTHERASGEGSRSEGHRRGVLALAHEVLPMSSAIACQRSQDPSLRTRCCPWLRTGHVYLRRSPRRRQPPSRFRPGCALAASHSWHLGVANLATHLAAAVFADRRGSQKVC